jgi:PIN domain nuclease of toxin-antitoxin system
MVLYCCLFFPKILFVLLHCPSNTKTLSTESYIAQTIVEKLKIISKDDNYDTYGIDLLW